MNKLGKLLLSLFKVGCIGFGGGNALVPVIEKEVVKKHKLVTQKQYNKFIVAANITPGALPVEIAVALGKEVGGVLGLILAPICIATPGVLATLLLIIVFSSFSGEAITQVKYASVGISVYIMYLLFMYNKKIWDQYELTSMKLKRLMITLLIVILTFGGEIYKIFGIERTPLFDISTVHVLLISFFVIFSTGKKMTKLQFVIDSVVCCVYILCVGKSQIISNKYVLYVIYVIMALVSVDGIRRSFQGEKIKAKSKFIKVIKEEVGLLLFMVIGSIPAILLSTGALAYLGKGYASSVISFGGGEAYLTVAQSLFENIEIHESQLYSQLLPVVNALPGSILTKMLAGVGYYQGLNATGSALIGVLVALAGFFVAISASGAVLCAVMYVYDMFEKLTIFELLGKCIKPIVGGLLVSTGLGLFYQMQQILVEGCALNLPIILVFTALIVALILLLKRIKKLPDFAIILICGAVSLVVCNLL
ncbi:MAG: chromate transporter [Lachnospiraceae bacterium]|nr:chromate transporter [Lachnospiraceae bacterium]